MCECLKLLNEGIGIAFILGKWCVPDKRDIIIWKDSIIMVL